MGTQQRDTLRELSDHVCQRVRARLEGLGDDEYFWEPVAGCWTVRPMPNGVYRTDMSVFPPDPPPVATIAWRLAHITDILSQSRNATWLGLVPVADDDLTAAPDAASARARYDGAVDVWNGYLEAVDDDVLARPIGAIGRAYAEHSRATLVLHEIDEVIHHGAEVALLRDLYRAGPRGAAIDAGSTLTDAVLHGDREAVDRIVNAGRDALEQLQQAHPELVATAAANGRWDAVQLAAELGFDVSARRDRTALHDAAGTGNLEMVRFLVERGADTTAIDDHFHAAPIAWAQYFDHRPVIAFLEALPD
jgi:hypothetical protein